MRAALLTIALLCFALGAHAADGATQTLGYDHSRELMADAKKCSIDPPRQRDFSWLGYKEINGFAYKNTRAVGGFFKTLKGVVSPKACFKACVDTRGPPGPPGSGSPDCLSFRYEPSTKRCGLSKFTIPFDPTDPRDLKTAPKWCPEKGYISGWTIFMYD